MGVKWKATACAINSGGQLSMGTFDGNSFGIWQYVDSGFGLFAPTGIQWAPNQIAVMACTKTGYLNYYAFDTSSGVPVQIASRVLGNNFVGRPAAVAWARNRLNIYATGADGHLYEIKWDGSNWSDSKDLGAGVAGDPAAVLYRGTLIGLAVVAGSGNISYKYSIHDQWNPSDTGWWDLGGTGVANQHFNQVTLLPWNGNWLSVFAVGADGIVRYKAFDGASWIPALTGNGVAGWQTPIGGSIAARVAVASWGPGQFTVLGTSYSNRVVTTFWDSDNNCWGPPPGGPGFSDFGLDTAADFTRAPVAATFRGGSILALVHGSDNRIYQRVWDGSNWTPAWSSASNDIYQTAPAVFSWVAS
jgi:hypothetical protein